MKRVVALTLFVLTALALAACPIYESASCYDSSDCRSGEYCGMDGQCHYVPPGSGENPRRCYAPGDCGPNQTCGADSRCHPGDCSYPTTGCVAGYECVATSDSGHVCVLGSGQPDGGSEEVPYCGSPDDCAAGETCAADGLCHPGDCGDHPCINGFVCATTGSGPSCVRGNPAACGKDDDCEGGACIDGLCAPISSLCSDGSQCGNNKACVDGRCIVRCTTASNCPTGFGCDLSLGVCTETGAACIKTEDCTGPYTVCTQGSCVPRCSAGGTCAKGSVCVDNGCVPRTGIAIDCDIDGTQDACEAGQVCLRHHCYDSCEAPNETTCEAKPVFNLCKSLTTATGTHAVCGSKQNLGDECDISIGKGCEPSQICIDGTCR